MSYSVGQLAQVAGVSVRTLHHYDDVGLLTPAERTRAGYRRYTPADAERLHRILVYRELGFDLARIARILDDSAVDAVEQLRRQHALLQEQVRRLEHMLRGIETVMESRMKGIRLSPEEMKEVFGSFNPADHEAEAEARWGKSPAYQESQQRAASYGKNEWLQIGAEAEEISAGFATAMARGAAPTDGSVMDLAEEHRRHITRWFYECTYVIHRGLGEMYVADPRFAKHYDDRAPGLSAYIREAIVANAERGG
jgi:MerR family transcriptional regulator, thiopeptide resistance regulator